MTRRPIGYYVHHHGAGHLTRAKAIAAASDWPITLIGTGIGSAGIDLPDDRPVSGQFGGDDGEIFRPSALHYAPTDHDGVRRRVAMISQWIASAQPALMLVDVSVEVAMLARLASVPTVYVRLNGLREDAPHLDAFRAAAALLAPFAEALEPDATPAWVRAKTIYHAGITTAPIPSPVRAKSILVVFGRGGGIGDGETLAQAAQACPDWHWRVIGPATPPNAIPANLEFAGWVDGAAAEIASASLIIGAAGDGLVSAVLASDKAFICIPEARPFGEQQATATRLGQLGAAVVLPQWPPPASWPRLIDAACTAPATARRALHQANGAASAAAWLSDLARQISAKTKANA